jgi:DNA recombination protein RmuC
MAFYIPEIGIEYIYLMYGAGSGLIIGGLTALLRAKFYEQKFEFEKQAYEQAHDQTMQGMNDHFKALAMEALKSNNEQFLTLAGERMKSVQNDAKFELEKRTTAIKEMVSPVEKHLFKLNDAIEQLHGTKKTLQDDLRNLHRETAKLSSALKDPAAQGRWGEFVLERLLDKSGLIKGQHYQTQKTLDNGMRPDVIISLHDGFNIVIDAKAPINDLAARMDEDLSNEEIKQIQDKLAKQVRSHIKSLGSKSYWENLDSPDFVVLFVPSENLFSSAMRADPTLIDYASENQVVIASPTLMMSLLRVVGMSWRQVELAKNAADIASLGSELFDRVSVFATHMDKVGKGLKSASDTYDKAVSSLQSRVLVSADKLRKMHVSTSSKELPEIKKLEVNPKTLSITPPEPEDIEQERKVSSG